LRLRPRGTRLVYEQLEDRAVPSTFTVKNLKAQGKPEKATVMKRQTNDVLVDPATNSRLPSGLQSSEHDRNGRRRRTTTSEKDVRASATTPR
jgi:hypothetical protein